MFCQVSRDQSFDSQDGRFLMDIYSIMTHSWTQFLTVAWMPTWTPILHSCRPARFCLFMAQWGFMRPPYSFTSQLWRLLGTVHLRRIKSTLSSRLPWQETGVVLLDPHRVLCAVYSFRQQKALYLFFVLIWRPYSPAGWGQNMQKGTMTQMALCLGPVMKSTWCASQDLDMEEKHFFCARGLIWNNTLQESESEWFRFQWRHPVLADSSKEIITTGFFLFQKIP